MRSARTEDTPWLGTVEDDLVGLLGRKRYVRVGGVHGAGLGLLVAGLARRFPAVLVVTADARLAEAVALDTETFSGRPALRLSTWPSDPAGTPDADVLAARVQVLTTLRAARAGRAAGSPRSAAPVVVAPVAALVQDVPPRSAVEGAMLVLDEGKEHSLPSLLEHLALSGYVRVAAVESPGEFASRGGVLDLFPFGAPSPARVDFFGDAIESIAAFDPATGRLGARAARLEALCLPPDRVRDPAPAWGPALATDHLPDDGLVVVVEPASVAAKVATAKAEARGTDRMRLRRADQALAARRRLDLVSLRLSTDGDLDVGTGALDDLRGLAARAEAGRARRGAAAGAQASPEAVLVEAFRRLAARADRVVVWRRALGEEERLVELLAPGSHPAVAGSGTSGSPIDVAGVPVTFAEGSLSASFLWPPTRTAHVAYDDLADLSVRERRPAPSLPPSRPIQDFLELEPGEPVVHLHHGIGIFRGLVAGDPKREPGQFLAIEFEGGTTMHVPVARIDLVQRYIGTGRRPKLSRLGGAEWGARKQKVADAVAAFAEDLLAVQAMRGERRGEPLRPHPEWQKEFEDAFPWRDTPDQSAATDAIKKDLVSPRPMDRLLCGDVGYGKTEVALRAAFLAATNGRQVAVLVPTTVLAEQHVRTFSARLAAYPIVVRALSRFRTPAEQREILAGLADGSVDVVVGTHRLLSKDVVFADLGLVVVDEEQRFGVQHKERLKALRADVDVLTLSATPIPRTLHMALLGLRDISNLTTPPPGRQPIETRLARTDDALVREAVRRELDRGGQVFFVHNKVFDLHLIAAMVMRLVPEARTATVHGQMDKDAVEERMLGFVRGDVDVLVTTTIVESGLDIPNANTMIVHNADRFGLAELHQLRGRVGREQRHAHCLLLIDKDRALSEEAAHRLRALEEYSELGAGFRIAMRDLELRGAGNLLGAQQSGHIASVGYDLYCRLLADAVRAAKKDLPAASPLAALDVELPCGVPTTYVKDPRETFRIFRRVASATTLDLLSELRAEVEGRFGPPPPDTQRLFLHQAVRILAGAGGIARVAPAEAGGLVLEANDPRALDRLEADRVPLRRLEPRRAYFPPPPSAPAGDVPRSLAAAVERLEALLAARAPGAPPSPGAHAAFPGPRPHG